MSVYLDFHTHQTDALKAIVNYFPCAEIPKTWFSMGIHPMFVDNLGQQKKWIEKWVLYENCLAVGEFGLDKRSSLSMEEQIALMSFQFNLAEKVQKPAIVHCVQAHHYLYQYLQQHNITVPIILHGFNQKQLILNDFKKSCYFSFGKALLFDDSNAQKALLQLPLEKIFLETDDAEISIEEIYVKASKLLNLSIENLHKQIQQNFKQVFHARL